MKSSSSVDIASVGEPAPDFTVELISGDFYTLSEAEGRVVVLNFWASWCGPCREEMPEISAFASANPDIEVIGVAVEDTEQTARDFAEEVNVDYPLAFGTEAVEEAYPRLGLPVTYILDRDLIVIEVFNGILNSDVLEELVGGRQ